MKKVLIACFALAALVACNSGGTKDEPKKEEVKEGPKKEEVQETNNLSNDPVYLKGLALATKSDCFTCHKIDEVLVGPTYRSVANKYAGYSDTIVTHLANKIISGGTGVWGEVPMLPHPAISLDDAKAIVKYVLLLKK
jgi:cytochrome c